MLKRSNKYLRDATDDTVIIDCGGFDSDITRYSISQADYILTPSSDDAPDQLALIEFNRVMKEVSASVSEKLTAKIILNKVHHSRSDFSDFDSLIDGLDYLERLPFTIPHSALIPKASFKGGGVKSGNIASKFLKLSKEVIK